MIFFCGDPHGNFGHIVRAVLEHRPVGVVLLGDLQPMRPLEIELAPILNLTDVWWIPGNHDTDKRPDTYQNLFGSALADRNIHGRVVDIAGTRVAGLGGVFRGSAWFPPSPARFNSLEAMEKGLRSVPLVRGERSLRMRTHVSSIFPDDYNRLAGETADILAVHEAPSCHPFGVAAIDELGRELGVEAVYHGHHHDRRDYGDTREALGFQAIGVGFCGITDETGRVIVAGDFDGDPA